MVCKPKSRAAGQPIQAVAISKDRETADAAVRRFGSGKYMGSSDAALLAAQRASDLQLELGSKPLEEITYDKDACVSAKTANPKIKKDGVMFEDSKTGGIAMSSAVNPRTGEIPDIKPDEEGQTPCLWGKEVSPLDSPLLNYTDVEEGARQLCNIDESWLYHDEVDPILGPTPSDLNERQLKLETRRGGNKPLAEDRITPFVRSLMVTEHNAGVSTGIVHACAGMFG